MNRIMIGLGTYFTEFIIYYYNYDYFMSIKLLILFAYLGNIIFFQ